MVSTGNVKWHELTQVEQALDNICIFLLLATAKGGPAAKQNFKSFKSTEELKIKR